MFDPEKVKKYLLPSQGQGDPGGVFVSWWDYKELLERRTKWISVDEDKPPFPPHSHDGATERVLVWVEKDYYPHVYTGCYEYTEDGSYWDVDGSGAGWGRWRVTHWAKEPSRPENGQK